MRICYLFQMQGVLYDVFKTTFAKSKRGFYDFLLNGNKNNDIVR